MKTIILGFFIALTFGTLNLFAHGDHFELDKDGAIAQAKSQIEQLVSDKKLPASWSSATPLPEKTNMKHVEGRDRWVAVFENSAEKDVSKKTLEVLLTPAGKFVSHRFAK